MAPLVWLASRKYARYATVLKCHIIVYTIVIWDTNFVRVRCGAFNPFTADPIKALHFAIMV